LDEIYQGVVNAGTNTRSMKLEGLKTVDKSTIECAKKVTKA